MRVRTCIQIGIFLAIIVPVGGCQTRLRPIYGDPNDPNRVTAQVRETRLDPNIAAQAVGAAEVAVGVAQGAGSTGIPWLSPIATFIYGALALGLAAWKKVGPQLVQYQSDYAKAHAVAVSAVTLIEEYKKKYPDTWQTMGEKMKEELAKFGIDPIILENLIRGMRGLPAKE